MTTSYSLSKPLTSTPVPWWWNDAIAASRSFMLKPAFPSLACAPSDATISSRSSIGHSGKNDGRRSAPLDALQLPSNRSCASSQKRRSFGPASEAGGEKSAKSSLVLAVLSGQSRRNVARRFDVSPSCVIKLMQQRETTGDCLPREFGGHKRHALAEHEDKVRALVAAQPDLTITALWKKLTALKIKVGRSAVGRFLLHLKLTYKKNAACDGTAK